MEKFSNFNMILIARFRGMDAIFRKFWKCRKLGGKMVENFCPPAVLRALHRALRDGGDDLVDLGVNCGCFSPYWFRNFLKLLNTPIMFEY